MRLLLFLSFLIVPVLEIWLLFQVGSAIGGLATVALLIAGALLGSWIIRREGRRAWRALQESLRSGRMPERELADSGLVLTGGALLLMPGFLTDLAGLAFVLPVTRPLMRRLGVWFFERRIKRLAATSPYGDLFPPAPGGQAPHGGRVVTGEVIREDSGDQRHSDQGEPRGALGRPPRA
ncbi:FxsA family protein [Nonomuraea sp. LP-02]|uniref:FxsA family protein n=1 Tax=Nonomuraea sp. LP-02 TaxID=3097960 RepID=UPI002E30630C|nr:FxsA family protein [Nonomuraea sp. LP-02]MED7924681.1 FxsA family protein [Nonomuraea sp. LP-02]